MTIPKVLYPTLVKGYISGPIRCESLDGDELYLPEHSGKINIPPFEQNGKTWCVSHLQKKSKAFTLVFDPFVYHKGMFLKLQERRLDPNGVAVWAPGTEVGLYMRTPGWRWDSDPKVREKNGGPWVWTWGTIAGHLD